MVSRVTLDRPTMGPGICRRLAGILLVSLIVGILASCSEYPETLAPTATATGVVPKAPSEVAYSSTTAAPSVAPHSTATSLPTVPPTRTVAPQPPNDGIIAAVLGLNETDLIVETNLATGEVREVFDSEGGIIDQLLWDQVHGRYVITSDKGNPHGVMRIYLVEPEETRRLPSIDGRISDVAVSPADGGLAYVVEDSKGGVVDYRIFYVDPRNGARRQLAHNEGSIYTLAWSPDGSRLAFVAESQPGPLTTLYLISLNSGEVMRLAESENLGSRVFWHENGAQILVNAYSKGQAVLLSKDVASGGSEQISPAGTSYDVVSLAPASGRVLAYAGNQVLVTDINFVPLSVVYTEPDSGPHWPVSFGWSPDGGYLIFYAENERRATSVWAAASSQILSLQLFGEYEFYFIREWVWHSQ